MANVESLAATSLSEDLVLTSLLLPKINPSLNFNPMKYSILFLLLLSIILVNGACKKDVEVEPELEITIDNLLGEWEVYAYYNESLGEFVEHGFGPNYLFISVYASGVEFHLDGTFRYLPKDYPGYSVVHNWELSQEDGTIQFFHDPNEYLYYIIKLDNEELWISKNDDGFSTLGYKLLKKEQ